MSQLRAQFVLIRHGQTAWNEIGRIQGQKDTPLNETGLRQAERLINKLENASFDSAYTSDLQRAVQTLQPFLQARQMKAVEDVRLREWLLGDFQGLTFAEAEVKYPVITEQFRNYDPDFAVPGGESFRAFYHRVTDFFRLLATRHTGETVLVVTHGGVIRVLLRDILGVSLTEQRRYYIENLCETRVESQLVGDSVQWRLLETEAVPIPHG